MSLSLSVLVQPRVPRAAFGKIVRNEARLGGRQSRGGLSSQPSRFGDLISYQDDGKGCTAIAVKVEMA